MKRKPREFLTSSVLKASVSHILSDFKTSEKKNLKIDSLFASNSNTRLHNFIEISSRLFSLLKLHLFIIIIVCRSITSA